MSKKQYPKLTISLRKEDEELILKIRAYLENKYKKQYSLADVVRHCTENVANSNEI